EVVARQAVYALPAGSLAEDAVGALPTRLSQSLLVDHLALVGAAPFERRPLPIAAALAEAERLGAVLEELPPLPSLTAEDPPAGRRTAGGGRPPGAPSAGAPVLRRLRSQRARRPVGSGPADLGEDGVDDLGRRHRAHLAALPVTDLDHAGGEATAHDH